MAGSSQSTAESAAVGEQGGSFAPGVVHGEEGEAVAVSGLSSSLAEKTAGPPNHPQSSTISLSANDLMLGVVGVLLPLIGGTRLSDDSWPVPGQPGLCERHPGTAQADRKRPDTADCRPDWKAISYSRQNENGGYPITEAATHEKLTCFGTH